MRLSLASALDARVELERKPKSQVSVCHSPREGWKQRQENVESLGIVRRCLLKVLGLETDIAEVIVHLGEL